MLPNKYINFILKYVKSELEEQRSHKVTTVISIKFDRLLLVGLQLYVENKKKKEKGNTTIYFVKIIKK